MRSKTPEGPLDLESRMGHTLSPFNGPDSLKSLTTAPSVGIASVQAMLTRQFRSMRTYYDSAVSQSGGLSTWAGEVEVVSRFGHNDALSTQYSVGVTSTDAAGIGISRTTRLIVNNFLLTTSVEVEGDPAFDRVSRALYSRTRTRMGPGDDVYTAELLELVEARFTRHGVVVAITNNPGLEFLEPRS